MSADIENQVTRVPTEDDHTDLHLSNEDATGKSESEKDGADQSEVYFWAEPGVCG